MPRASARFMGLAIAVVALAALSETGRASNLRQTAVVTFERPTWVTTTMLIGEYVIEHDDGRMARGEPCTKLYRVMPGPHPLEEAVSFHCIPRERPIVSSFSMRVRQDPASGIDTLVEYQFGGDPEGHGVPGVALAEIDHPGMCQQTARVAKGAGETPPQ
jgi:hypothetical protein